MNDAAIAEFVKMWAVVNVAAMIVLAVMAYVSSVFILDWLEALDRRLSGREEGVSTVALREALSVKNLIAPGGHEISEKRPNKSPEPTPTAVTPRATEVKSK